MKCDICGKNIEETFLEKLKGTIVKMKKGDKNAIYHVCSECQKKFGDKIKEKLQ